MSIQTEYESRCAKEGDINEHLPTLRDLARECKHVTEMGVRYIVSTWAFLEGLKGTGGTLISIDFFRPSFYGGDLDTVILAAKNEGVDFKFVLGDTRLIEIEETDLLFIDTLHEYDQLKMELSSHASKVRKYLVFHDTTSFETKGERQGRGIWPAIEEFLEWHKEWQIKHRYTNNNGLLILERVC